MTARPTETETDGTGDAMRMGFGCVNLGSASSGQSWRADVRLVQEAIGLGVRHFDTADAYGGGASERTLGRAIRDRRDDVIIATKGGYAFRSRSTVEQRARRRASPLLRAVRRPNGPGPVGAGGSGAYQSQNFSPAAIHAAVDASLRRLNTDHIDVFQLHGPHRVEPVLFEQLDDLVTSGKVGRFGIGAERIQDADAWLCVRGVDVVQLPFGVLDPEPASATLAKASQQGVEVWARGVLGGGLLRAAEADPLGHRRDPKWPRIERLQALAERSGFDLYRLAVGFVQSFPQVSTILIGIGSSAHLHRNLQLVAAEPLDDDIMAEIRSTVGVRDG